jgi:hypothetical protein
MIVRAAAYIVRDKRTQKAFPSLDTRADQARSHFALADPARIAPRQFATYSSAQETLKHWLRGKRIGGKTFPQPDRVQDDMEIVPVSVILEWT